jgi:hypothetical protein
MKNFEWLDGWKRRIAIVCLLAAQAVPLWGVPNAAEWVALLTTVAVLLGGADIYQTVKK